MTGDITEMLMTHLPPLWLIASVNWEHLYCRPVPRQDGQSPEVWQA
jgi:hypothetical protein